MCRAYASSPRLSPGTGDPYGPLAIIFRQQYLRNYQSYAYPVVTKGLRDQGFTIAATPARRQDLRHLYPPERPVSPWQRLDRRVALIIDLAVTGLALFFFGRLVRAAELVGVAALLGAIALLTAFWLSLALVTGRFRRADLSAQATYERALRRWRALFYCEDCGSSFRRDRQGYLRPEAVPSYLRRDGVDETDRAANR